MKIFLTIKPKSKEKFKKMLEIQKQEDDKVYEILDKICPEEKSDKLTTDDIIKND